MIAFLPAKPRAECLATADFRLEGAVYGQPECRIKAPEWYKASTLDQGGSMTRHSLLLLSLGLAAAAAAVSAADIKWPIHDRTRPRASVVTPGTASTPEKAGKAPSDAIVLFDGTDLSKIGRAHV